MQGAGSGEHGLGPGDLATGPSEREAPVFGDELITPGRHPAGRQRGQERDVAFGVEQGGDVLAAAETSEVVRVR